jgi:hypothetical protein
MDVIGNTGLGAFRDAQTCESRSMKVASTTTNRGQSGRRGGPPHCLVLGMCAESQSGSKPILA